VAVDVAQEPTVRITAWNSVRTLIKSRTPVPYPPTSIASGRQGVVVADILIAPDGRVRTVEVVEAPDADIASAAAGSLKSWTFKPVSDPSRGVPAAVRSKIILYFHIRSGNGEVLTPDEMAARRAGTGSGVSQSGVPPAEFSRIGEGEYQQLVARSKPKPILVDVRDRVEYRRGAYPGAVNLPEREIGSRALAELPQGATIVLDCPNAVAELCRFAARALWQDGFRQVLLLHRN
jgi:rhodanese-related sulfurtransferase